jgi:chromosome segregation ATPase
LSRCHWHCDVACRTVCCAKHAVRVVLQTCCRLREQLGAERQAARAKYRELEGELQDAKLQRLTLEARLEASEDKLAASELEVQKLMEASSENDVAQARAAFQMERKLEGAVSQAAAYDAIIELIQVCYRCYPCKSSSLHLQT